MCALTRQLSFNSHKMDVRVSGMHFFHTVNSIDSDDLPSTNNDVTKESHLPQSSVPSYGPSATEPKADYILMYYMLHLIMLAYFIPQLQLISYNSNVMPTYCSPYHCGIVSAHPQCYTFHMPPPLTRAWCTAVIHHQAVGSLPSLSPLPYPLSFPHLLLYLQASDFAGTCLLHVLCIAPMACHQSNSMVGVQEHHYISH